ncbi:C40 family peptidase [Loigolactobacillus iwatensis]|uniref:C40 family peptidase n=1 Tax=Loigolactobacillus iwatensis TaxID=1267156 RepID=UPI000F7DBA31|nr:C40 family peptidase [Loigolactobacillus iwatensis]
MTAKKNLTKVITAGVVGIAGVTLLSIQTTSADAATKGTVTYHGGATTVWDNNSNAPRPLRYLVEGQSVNIEGTKQALGEKWYNIGNDQWVPAKYLKATDDQPTVTTAQTAAQPTAATTTNQKQTTTTTEQTTTAAQKVVAAAKSQIGVPYVWGGVTPGQGLDCSGLTAYAYSQAGVQLNHYTVSQESAGQQVALNQMQPGDLVFWGGVGATYHVGIYIGNNQYVAAPQPGQSVEIETISNYFMPSFGVHVL